MQVPRHCRGINPGHQPLRALKALKALKIQKTLKHMFAAVAMGEASPSSSPPAHVCGRGAKGGGGGEHCALGGPVQRTHLRVQAGLERF